MRKAASIATIVFFMGVMGYLSPKPANAIIAILDWPVIGPFTLVNPGQAAVIRFVKAAPRMGQGTDMPPPGQDRPCVVQVMFFDNMGRAAGDPPSEITLTDNHIMNVPFMPPQLPSTSPRARQDFVAQVEIAGDPKACMGVFITAAVYDMTSMSDVVPIKIFYGDLVPAV